MKKVIKTTLLLIMSSLSFIGCFNPSPSQTVDGFFKEFKQYTSEDLQEYINSTDSDDLLNEYDDVELTPELADAVTKFLNKFDAKILNETITDDTAVVNVELNAPKFTTVIKEYMGEAFSKALTSEFSNLLDTDYEETSDNLTKEFEKILINKLAEVEPEKRNISVNLYKEDGKWTILKDEKLASDILGLPNLDGLDMSSLFDM